MKYPAILLIAAASLHAGVKIESESVNGTRTSHQTVLIDSDKMRTDVTASTGESTTVMFLTDGGRDRIVILDKARNEYREIDQESINRMTQTMQGAMAQLNNLPPEQRAMVEKMMKGKMPGMGQAAKPEPISYQAKGSANVNGFACTMYEGTRSGEKVVELCAARPEQLKVTAADMQVFEKLKQFTASMTASVGNYARGIDQFTDAGVPGFPVRHVTYSGGQVSHRTEVKTVDRVSVSGAEFSTGSARKAELMPGQRRR